MLLVLRSGSWHKLPDNYKSQMYHSLLLTSTLFIMLIIFVIVVLNLLVLLSIHHFYVN